MHQLSIQGLRHAVRLGCQPEERSFPQVVTTDLEIETDMTKCIETDELSDAVDYEAVANAITRLSGDGEWKLIEKLAYDIGQHVLDIAPLADAVQVRVTKVILPQANGVAATVRVTR
ncbi:MAG: dihydroneopterin aldolase [Deltaproteobacteria bacterium]